MTDRGKVFVAVNASDIPYTACHGDLSGPVTELLSENTLHLNGSLEMPAYSILYLQF